MLRCVSALAFVAVLAGTTSALAQSCAGVEARVNVRTGQLQAAVEGVIDTTERADRQELLQRNQLLSAFKVMTAQSATASDQVTTAHKQAASATASTAVTRANNLAVAAASHRYQSVGYDPCGSNARHRPSIRRSPRRLPPARRSRRASSHSPANTAIPRPGRRPFVREPSPTERRFSPVTRRPPPSSMPSSVPRRSRIRPDRAEPQRGDADRLGKAERDAMKSVGTSRALRHRRRQRHRWTRRAGEGARQTLGRRRREARPELPPSPAITGSAAFSRTPSGWRPPTFLALQVKKGARTETAAATFSSQWSTPRSVLACPRLKPEARNDDLSHDAPSSAVRSNRVHDRRRAVAGAGMVVRRQRRHLACRSSGR